MRNPARASDPRQEKELMDIRKLQKIVVSALEDIKAKEIEVINTTKLTGLTR